MKAYPRHAGCTSHGIRVVGLMHVPEETDVSMLHDRHISFNFAVCHRGYVHAINGRDFRELWYEGLR